MLRATAVLLVLVGHTIVFVLRPVRLFPILDAAGYAGVVIFFVHTSLVLMRSLARSERRGLAGWERARDFYVRRAFRIYPLAMTTVAAVIAFHLPRMPRDLVYHQWQPRTVLANFMLIQNGWGGGSVLGPLWSLPLEVQMYVVLPAVFVAVRGGNAARLALAAIVAVAAASAQLHFGHAVPGLWRLNVLQYAPCFVAGAVAYRLCERWRPRLPGALWPLLLSTLLAAGIAATALEAVGIVLAWVTAGAIGVAIPLTREMRESWITKSAHTVAKYSYGIYLSHIAVLDVVLLRMPHAPVVLRMACGVVGIVGIPVLLYHGLENPMIRIGATLAARLGHRRAYVTALSSTAPAP